MLEISELSSQIARSVQNIYKSSFNEEIVNRIIELTGQKLFINRAWDEKDILLITYGNSIKTIGERPLITLNRFLDANLINIFSGIHVLPFFPYTSDDGFAVSDYLNVNPVLGNWEDITAIGKNFDLMADLVINHISSEHNWFRNFLMDKSPGKDYFIEAEFFKDVNKVIRPRSSPLFTQFQTSKGLKRVWTTFGPDQIDLNFSNPEVLVEMIKVLIYYLNKGIRFIRLDAVAFLWKRNDTTCLHLNETHEIVKLLRIIAEQVSPGTIIITETNVPNKENWSYFGNNDEAHMVYQFSLPPVILYTLFTGDSFYLNNLAREMPCTEENQAFLNYTASHDGIGLRPLEGILPENYINKLIDAMKSFGGLVSMRSDINGTMKPYEINITFFDALKGNIQGIDNFQEIRFICSQSLMIALKGIPAIYIHSLFSTPNDYEGIINTGMSRSINRYQYIYNELIELLDGDNIHSRIYMQILKLIKIRRKYTAFHPQSLQEIFDYGSNLFVFTRFNKKSSEKIICIFNISDKVVELKNIIAEGRKGFDIITEKEYYPKSVFKLNPYQFYWLLDQKV